uniref:Uncharacterized protein n=1 Tax=Meloidogyne enterolobii TaxID=390850 RepID=A0A6V7XH11_MELEN|nr:unnamed protein product [Meloidogyne enterolobii]
MFLHMYLCSIQNKNTSQRHLIRSGGRLSQFRSFWWQISLKRFCDQIKEFFE